MSENFEEIRSIFLQPSVTDDYALDYDELQEEMLYRFLCEERDFSRERVRVVVERMRKVYTRQRQVRLEKWFSNDSQTT